MIIHIVTAGESLSQLAAEYGVDIRNLAADNGISTNDSLVVGQALVVQIPEVVHTVQRGETLTSIAAAYGITAVALLRNNFWLKGSSRLVTGDRIVISYSEQQKKGTFSTNSYAYPHVNSGLLRSQMPYLTYFTPFTYGIAADGGLVDLNDGEMRRIAGEYGTDTLLHLSTLTEGGGFSSERASMIFQNDAMRERLTDDIIQTVDEKNFTGVDVDFEFIAPSEKYDYIQFLQELRLRLNPQGKLLFSAVAPKTYDDQPGVLYEGHDYAGIGAAVNFVLLMTYEWGYTYSEPMAVAPLPSVRRVVEYATTRISANKLFMGIPTYGYDWTLPYVKGGAGASSISPVEAVNLARRYGADILYDETAQSPWFRYTDDDGRLHEVWFEDARSISAKLALANQFGLYGIGYWNSMRDFPQNWVILNAEYDILNLSLL